MRSYQIGVLHWKMQKVGTDKNLKKQIICFENFAFENQFFREKVSLKNNKKTPITQKMY